MSTTEKGNANLNTDMAPTVSIILPFEPMMCPKSNLQRKLEDAFEKVSNHLRSHYAKAQSLPVILKLKRIIQKLNYNTHRKSISIFVSPITEKVCYFNIPVEERIIVDEPFGMLDVLRCKKENMEYLVLLLCDQSSVMYHGSPGQLNLIKSNLANNMLTKDNVENAETDTLQFLKRIDKGLSLVLEAYQLPVLVAGPQIVLEKFKRITTNIDRLVVFIDHDDIDPSAESICRILYPYIRHWDEIKCRSILLQLEKAQRENHLLTSADQISSVSASSKLKLLVCEINDSFLPSSDVAPEEKRHEVLPHPFYIKNRTEDLIRKILEKGGDAELVDPTLLDGYGDFILIQQA